MKGDRNGNGKSIIPLEFPPDMCDMSRCDADGTAKLENYVSAITKLNWYCAAGRKCCENPLGIIVT